MPSAAFAGSYVAIGTSVSAGWSATGHTWFPDPDNSGYVNLLFLRLKDTLGVDQLLNYSEPGATGRSILYGGESILTNPQLPPALAEIGSISDTKAVTVEVGANEYFEAEYSVCVRNWDSPACPFRENVALILSKLKSALAADPGEEFFAAMGYINPGAGTASEEPHDLGLLGANLSIGCSDAGEDVGLNDIIYQEADRFGVDVADPYPAFKSSGGSFMADRVHPTDAGHEAIAQAFLRSAAPCPGTAYGAYGARLGKFKIDGPKRAKKGMRVAFTVRISNTGNIDATRVRLRVGGAGVQTDRSVGTVAAGRSKKVMVTLTPRKPGRLMLTFNLASSNAGSKRQGKRLIVNS
jgi:lysophospholipase L1-like esterase